jgi:hypothetical protein
MSETNHASSEDLSFSLTQGDANTWQLEEEVIRNREFIQQLHEKVEGMERQLERLTVTCSSMWSLLQKKSNLSENDLLEKIQELDIQEGRSNEKVNRGVVICENCSRQISSKYPQCLYCGHPAPTITAFGMVQSVK